MDVFDKHMHTVDWDIDWNGNGQATWAVMPPPLCPVCREPLSQGRVLTTRSEGPGEYAVECDNCGETSELA